MHRNMWHQRFQTEPAHFKPVRKAKTKTNTEISRDMTIHKTVLKLFSWPLMLLLLQIYWLERNQPNDLFALAVAALNRFKDDGCNQPNKSSSSQLVEGGKNPLVIPRLTKYVLFWLWRSHLSFTLALQPWTYLDLTQRSCTWQHKCQNDMGC